MTNRKDDKHIRVKKTTHDELRKFKNLYELQDNKSYSIDDVINMLMRDRIRTPFQIPITENRKEAIEYYSITDQ